MANLFTRMKDMILADLHGLIDEKEQKNPLAVLNLYLRQSEQETERVRELVERQYRLRAELMREYQNAQSMAEKRLHQSKVAQEAGEEGMAQFAQKEYEEYQGRTERMKVLCDEAASQIERLEQRYEEMKHRLKDMRLKRLELMGRENILKAEYQINKVLEPSADQSFTRFAELDRCMEEIEFKINSAYYRSTFDSKIAQLEKDMKNSKKISETI